MKELEDMRDDELMMVIITAIQFLSRKCYEYGLKKGPCIDCHKKMDEIRKAYDKISERKTGEWIPVSKRLPEDTDPVNITWINHDPEPYYATIKDKPYTATGCYCDGKWYWYSVSCQDYLDEYGRSDVDAMDEAIEVIAWMPLPTPFESQESEDLGDYPDVIHNQFDNLTGSMNL